MKKILILNGSSRRKGRTDSLSNAFKTGAEEAGHHVEEIFTETLHPYFTGALWSDDQGVGENPYQLSAILMQHNEVSDFYKKVIEADMIVFATPIYWWGISGSLKLTVDYLQPLLQAIGYQKFTKESALLAVAGGSQYDHALSWYGNFNYYLNWPNHGVVVGHNKEDEAYQLGKSI